MTRPINVWQALARPGYLLTSWPWRSAGYLLSSAPLGVVALVAIVVGATVGSVLAVVLIGLPLLALVALSGVPVAATERLRLRLVDNRPAPTPHRMPAEPGLVAWARTRFREQATWRELGYTLVFATVLWPLDLLALSTALAGPLGLLATPVLMMTVGDGEEARVLKMWTATSLPEAIATAVVGLLMLPVCGYVLGVVAVARAELTRLLIAAPAPDLGERVTELVRSRVRLVDAFEAERRRIERDLHDGAQQRIVALTMALGLARLDAPPGPLADQLAKAHDEAGKALAELNAAVAGQLVVSEAAVGKHIGNILAKLDLPPADETHRRVLAVLTFLRA